MTQQEIPESNMMPSEASFCPSGCGTPLVKQKFVDCFDENMEHSLQDAEEDFYCPKCGIRWIPEQHVPLKTGEDEKTKNAKKPETATPVEYEQVTIKVPKLILEFLRKTDPDNEGPTAWIEQTVVDDVRAQIEGADSLDWASCFGLGPVFREVLGDKRYQ